MGRKKIGIENDDTGRTQTLRGDPITPPRQPPAGGDRRRADPGTDRDPAERRDEIVFERIFHHENNTEEEGESAAPTPAPIVTRPRGVMRLFSKEYFTMKITPRKRESPPSQANSFTPMNASQLK